MEIFLRLLKIVNNGGTGRNIETILRNWVGRLREDKTLEIFDLIDSKILLKFKEIRTPSFFEKKVYLFAVEVHQLEK